MGICWHLMQEGCAVDSKLNDASESYAPSSRR
jgi:hypothetical protein